MRVTRPSLLVLTTSLLVTLSIPQGVLAQESPAANGSWQELRRFPVPAEYPRVASVTLSASGERVGYVATWQEEDKELSLRVKKTALFIDGEKYSEDFYEIPSATFSPDGAHLAFVTVTPINNSLQAAASWQLHLDRKTLPGCGSRRLPVFSPDGARVAWLALASSTLFKSTMALYVDGTVVSENVERPFAWSNDFEMDSEQIVAFSPDGGKVAFTTMVGKKRGLVVNGSDIVGDVEMVGPPKFAPDGRLAFQVKEKKSWCIMIDGTRATADHKKIGKPVFSADGKVLAYRACDKKLCAVYIDGRRVSPELDTIGPIALSPDGSTVAYPVKDGKIWTVYIQDRRLPVEFTFSKLGDDGLKHFVLNRGGSKVAYVSEVLQDDDLTYYGVPEETVLMVNDRTIANWFTALDFVVVGNAIVFAGHDPRSHQIVVGTLDF